MPPALRAPSVVQGLSEIAEEFKRLDRHRRTRGLSLSEAGPLSSAVRAIERRARARRAHSSRRHAPVSARAVSHDVDDSSRARRRARDVPRLRRRRLRHRHDERFDLDDDVWLDGADLEGEQPRAARPRHGRVDATAGARRAGALWPAVLHRRSARSAIRSIASSIACSTAFSPTLTRPSRACRRGAACYPHRHAQSSS